MSCHICLNAYVDPDLTHDNDLSYHSIGHADTEHQITFRSGANRPTEILIEKRVHQKDRAWSLVGYYKPNYCPNCRRKLIENKQREED